MSISSYSFARQSSQCRLLSASATRRSASSITCDFPGGHLVGELKEILFSQPNLLIKTIILNTKSLASGPKHWSWLKPRVYTSILAIVSVSQRWLVPITLCDRLLKSSLIWVRLHRASFLANLFVVSKVCTPLYCGHSSSRDHNRQVFWRFFLRLLLLFLFILWLVFRRLRWLT